MMFSSRKIMIEDHPFIPIFDRSIKAYKEGDIHAFKEAIREMAESSYIP